MMDETVCQVAGNEWDMNDLNLETASFISDMHRCMKANADESPTISAPYDVEWWSSKIDKLQKKLKTIRHYLRKWCYKRLNRDLPDFEANKMKYTWEDLKTARRLFKKACRKAKKLHFRKFVSAIDRTEVTASINKRLNKENNAEIGLFTKPDGQRCSVDETMDLLKDTHFPGNPTPPPGTAGATGLSGRYHFRRCGVYDAGETEGLHCII